VKNVRWFLFLFLLISNQYLGATGYKNYDWGIGLEKITSNASAESIKDGEQPSSALSIVLRISYPRYFEKNYLETLGAMEELPVSHNFQKYSENEDPTEHPQYYFDQGKLYGVYVIAPTHYLNELINKYGNKKSHGMMMGNSIGKVYFWDSKDKSILAVWKDENDTLFSVYYFDPIWLKQMRVTFDKNMKSRISKQTFKNKRLLD
jgi:hypothetical protein